MATSRRFLVEHPGDNPAIGRLQAIVKDLESDPRNEVLEDSIIIKLPRPE